MKRVWERLRRHNYLAELQAVLVVALLAGAVAAAVNVYDVITGKPITVAVDGDGLSGPDTVAGLRPGVHLDQRADLQVVIDHPTAQQIGWHAARSLPWFVLAMFTLATLLLVVRAARRDDPFSAANVRRLRLIGWVLTIGSVVAFYLELLAGLALSTTVTTGTPNAGGRLPVTWAVGGLCFLALSEVVKRGRALRDELATVI
jgi:hypothetical protein